jgi:hypothetical protein
LAAALAAALATVLLAQLRVAKVAAALLSEAEAAVLAEEEALGVAEADAFAVLDAEAAGLVLELAASLSVVSFSAWPEALALADAEAFGAAEEEALADEEAEGAGLPDADGDGDVLAIALAAADWITGRKYSSAIRPTWSTRVCELWPGISTWMVFEPCWETCASDTPNALTRSLMMVTAVPIAPAGMVFVPGAGLAVNTALVPPARSIARCGLVFPVPNMVAYSATTRTANNASGRQGPCPAPPATHLRAPERLPLRVFLAATLHFSCVITVSTRPFPGFADPPAG